MNKNWNNQIHTAVRFALTLFWLPTMFTVACSLSDDKNTQTDTGSVPKDSGTSIIDTESAPKDSGSATDDTAGTDVDTTSIAVDTASTNEDTESELFDTESASDDPVAKILPVALGAAGNFVILAKSGISNVPTSAITGALGVSPAAATFLTGFSLSADSTNVFSTSLQVTGNVFAADYNTPTPSNLTAAVNDMQLAFTNAAGRAPNVTELGAGTIGGMTFAAGVYKWSNGVIIPTSIILSGNDTDVWIFQIAGNLTVSSASKVILSNGAMSKNIFWQVSGLVDLGTTSHFEGVVLSKTSVSLRTGASINGRLLAQTAVDLDNNIVTKPE